MTPTAVAVATPSTGPGARPSHPPCPTPRNAGRTQPGVRHARRAGLLGRGVAPRGRAMPMSGVRRPRTRSRGGRSRVPEPRSGTWWRVPSSRARRPPSCFSFSGGWRSEGPRGRRPRCPPTGRSSPRGSAKATSFRLLFATSTTRSASSSDIDDYNTFVQNRAAGGTQRHPVPLGRLYGRRLHRGRRCPRQYLDDVHLGRQGRPHLLAERQQGRGRLRGLLRQLLGRREERQGPSRGTGGTLLPLLNRPFTGCNSDGTAHSSHLGNSARVVAGAPDASISNLGPIGPRSGNGYGTQATPGRPFYALSKVFEVGPRPRPKFVSAAVSADGRSIDITFDVELDPDRLPAQYPRYPVSLRLDGKTIYAQNLTVPPRTRACSGCRTSRPRSTTSATRKRTKTGRTSRLRRSTGARA